MGKILETHRKPYSVKKLICSGLLLSLPLFTFAVNDNAQEVAPEIATGLQDMKQAQGKSWMVVTANDYASQAAAKILRSGGSAIDAAIAAQLVLGLVEPQSSGIGGGGFLVYWDNETKQLTTFDGRETAPSDVDEDHFLIKGGEPMPFFDAVVGGYAVGAPGLIDMLSSAHSEYGELAWSDLFTDAIALSEQGFYVSERLNQLLFAIKEKFPKGVEDNAFLDLFFDTQGKPRPVGFPLKNPKYAQTLKKIAEGGKEAFYNGDIAENIVKKVKSNGIKKGKLSEDDLASYKSVKREAICSDVGEYKLCGAPPPSSGPITVMQILAMLNKLPGQAGLAPDSAAFYHRFAEASKLAFADRNAYLADPDFVDMPISQLLDDEYIAKRAALIALNGSAIDKAKPGQIAQFRSADSFELPSTTHLSIVDQSGNVVSMTSSVEMAFGSRLMVDGFFLNNQLTDFSFTSEGVNEQLIANRIEPGKRPRSSMSPMIILNKKNEPILAIGSPGGSRIINYVAKTLAQHLYLYTPLSDAIESPHVVNMNKQTELEKIKTPKTENALNKLGHEVKIKEQNSGIHAISINKGKLVGVADPRREGSAIGF